MKKEVDSTNDQSNEPKAHHNNHSALRKLKDAEGHIEIMKRRFKVLKVKDDEYRSKTIQHYNKIKYHEDIHKTIVKDKE